MRRAWSMAALCCSAALIMSCGDGGNGKKPPKPEQCEKNQTACGTACCSAEEECVAVQCVPKAPCSPECSGATPLCEAGICKCNESSCGVGMVCAGGICVADPSCDPPCADTTPLCVNGTCQCDESSCEGHLVCISGACIEPPPCEPACSGATPLCVNGVCQCDETSCGAGENCVEGACVASACEPACDPTLPLCVDGVCKCDGLSCGEDATCVLGVCVAAQDCDPLCTGTTPLCVETQCVCAESSCGPVASCVSGVCSCDAGSTMCGLDCCADGTESCIEGSCVATAIDGCAVSPTYGMLNLAATAFPIGTPTNLITMEVPFPANEGSTTQLLIEARKGYGRFAEGFSTGEFELSGAELNYGTCGLCFLLHNSTEEETKRFMVTRGHVTITSVSGGFDLTLSNAAFEEVTLDASNLSTPVQDGCTVTLESAVFAGTFPPVPPNDLCGGEIALTLGALPLAGDNTYATPAYGNTPGDLSSACAPLATWGLAGKEVVYSYTPAESGPFTITVTPSRLTDLAIWYSTTCGDIATCEGGIDTLEPEETLTITGVAGIEYFIFVDTFDPTVGGPFTIQVRAAAAP